MQTLSAPYYVYEWVRPDFNAVFYVGKGKGGRIDVEKRNKDADAVIQELIEKGLKPRKQIIARFVNEQSCLDFEAERISFLLPCGWLTNVRIKGRAQESTFTEKWCAEQSERLAKFYATPEGKQAKESLSRRTAEFNANRSAADKEKQLQKQSRSMKIFLATDEGQETLRMAAEKRKTTVNSDEYLPKKEARNQKTRDTLKEFSKTDAGKKSYDERGRKCAETLALKRKQQIDALSDEKIKEILLSAESVPTLAKKHNLTKTIVRAILNREFAAHVTVTDDEISEKQEKRRSKCGSKGTSNPSATITDEIALAIFCAEGRQIDIARQFNVSADIVRWIKRKITWKHIHKEPQHG
jgi:hypothetical protein